MHNQLSEVHSIERLRKPSHYQYVFDAKRYFDTRSVRLYFRQKMGDDPAFGIITTKKLGGAVVRNRAKRQLKEIIRKNQVDIRQDCDLILIVKRAFMKSNSEAIKHDLLGLLNKITFK